MQQIRFNTLKRVLCLGAHSDDIEIGCGATLLRLMAERADLEVMWVVFSAEGRRASEAKASARAFVGGAAKAHIVIKSFRGSFFPVQLNEIKEFFETLKAFGPDLVLTHYRDDRHQDHRVLSDLAWNTFRNHLILEYEIPKYDGDFGVPNVFVPISKALCAKKAAFLRKYFKSQSGRHWFTTELFVSVARLRGMECASSTHYAEAFYGRKLLIR